MVSGENVGLHHCELAFWLVDVSNLSPNNTALLLLLLFSYYHDVIYTYRKPISHLSVFTLSLPAIDVNKLTVF